MNNIKISKDEARNIVLNSQLLDGKSKTLKSRQHLLKIINQLGYIQIDTISVINRAHHHILWTRQNTYLETDLHQMQTKDKSIFEYWTHAMSYVPMKDYRFSLHKMKNFNNPQSNWMKHRFKQSKKYFNPVLERIKNEGMLSSSDFENEDGNKAGGWWEWKPVKTALEYLFWRGDLMVAERRGFQKYYDLRERVLPSNIDTSLPAEIELNRFFIIRALASLGIATEKEIQKFMQPGKVEISDLQVTKRKTMQQILKEMCEQGEVIPIHIENDKNTSFAIPENLEIINKKKKIEEKIYLISPFDNLIIQRERTKRLFNFDYTIECYLPEAKRKYGYFVLPILWGNDFVGRIDCKADRNSKILIVNNLVFENGFIDYYKFIPQFKDQLNRFAEFNCCNKFQIKKCSPENVKKSLNSN